MPLVRTATDEEITRAILAGHRGEIEFEYELWASNIRGEKKRKIRTVDTASVDLSNFRDHTWELSINLQEDDAIDPFLDYVKLVIKMRTAIDEWLEFPMGLYRFDSPRGADNQFYTDWDLVGRSLESVLLDNMADNGYKVSAGTSVLSAVRTVLVAQGIPNERINFPSSTVTLTRDMIFSPFQDAEQCYWLRICNALLAAGAYYALWTDSEGYFTTREIAEGEESEVAIVYAGNGEPEDEGEELIVGELQWEYDREFFNQVVVYSGDVVRGPPIVAVARLHAQNVSAPNSWTHIVIDEDSPFSYEAQGSRFFTRPPEAFQQVTTTAEARKLAKRLLANSASRHQVMTIPTMPDPRRGPRETYRIVARRSDGTQIWKFKASVVGWTLPLDLTEMSHEVNRTVKH